MSDIERIPFEFKGDSALADLDRLEDIICSGGWGRGGLNYEDERTKTVLGLLRVGGIAVYRSPYTRQEATPELRRRADEINAFMNKRHVSQTIIDIASIYYDNEYNSSRTTYNSLFFPELKAFIRCGELPPHKILEMLEQDGCEAILQFHDEQSEDGDAFFIFHLAMPKDMLFDVLEKMEERIQTAMSEALQKTHDETGIIFPAIYEAEESE